MKLKVSNYNKPSDKKYKLIGDILIYSILLYTPIMLSLPISDNAKYWVSTIYSFVAATAKLISKFTLDNSYIDLIKDKEDVNRISKSTSTDKGHSKNS